MSRMSKFLKQTCVLEKALRDPNGSTKLDKFGEIMYDSPQTIKCRRERIIKDVQTNTGAILRSSTRYFTDDSVVVEADDRLDGRAIVEVEEYINAKGEPEGYESYV